MQGGEPQPDDEVSLGGSDQDQDQELSSSASSDVVSIFSLNIELILWGCNSSLNYMLMQSIFRTKFSVKFVKLLELEYQHFVESNHLNDVKR